MSFRRRFGTRSFKPFGSCSSNRFRKYSLNSAKARLAGVRNLVSGWHNYQDRSQSAVSGSLRAAIRPTVSRTFAGIS